MKLHDLQPDKGSKKKKTRLGRGIASGKGKTAGRGSAGAGARGRRAKSPAYFEGGQLSLVRRLPFKRGFTNIFRVEYQEVNVGALEEWFEAGTAITPEVLAAVGLIRKADRPVVILGQGDLKKSFTVRAHRLSKSAQQKITEAGGSFEVVPLPLTGARFTVKLLPKEKLAKFTGQA
jgi:large subunit ribosomal protein L15